MYLLDLLLDESRKHNRYVQMNKIFELGILFVIILSAGE